MILRAALPSAYRLGYTHPAGTEALVLEWCGDAVWVEIRVLDDALEGGAWFETFEVREDELV